MGGLSMGDMIKGMLLISVIGLAVIIIITIIGFGIGVGISVGGM
jgi:hypothetical protein